MREKFNRKQLTCWWLERQSDRLIRKYRRKQRRGRASNDELLRLSREGVGYATASQLVRGRIHLEIVSLDFPPHPGQRDEGDDWRGGGYR